jgi:hypothetical protein
MERGGEQGGGEAMLNTRVLVAFDAFDSIAAAVS